MKTEATLGSLQIGDEFYFGGVQFKVRFKDEDEKEEFLSCTIGETEKTVQIAKCAWVDLVEPKN